VDAKHSLFLQGMEINYIIIFCVLMLIAYVFDLTSSRTKIPSVILLLGLGFGIQQLTRSIGLSIPDLSEFLPLLGTIGLILIVLEGSLELELSPGKLGTIRKSFLGALIPIVLLASALAWLFHEYGDASWKNSLINAIPLCVISSAIAIPSVRNLSSSNREYIIYESSLSDIIGVLVFNFLALNSVIDGIAFLEFGWQLLLITIISFVATVVLSFLLSRIDHHIKFVPIILLIVLIYAISKIYHLPGLVFILLFGLFIGNLNKIKNNKWIQKLKPDHLHAEVERFHELIVEGTFLIRSLFFLLFGFLIESAEIVNTQSLKWALITSGIILAIRFIQLKISRLPLRPLWFIAPRGLITVLLFLSIPQGDTIPLVERSMIIQVILITAVWMMIGLMFNKTESNT